MGQSKILHLLGKQHVDSSVFVCHVKYLIALICMCTHNRRQNHSYPFRRLLQLFCLWQTLTAALIISAWWRNPPIPLTHLTINPHPPRLEGLTPGDDKLFPTIQEACKCRHGYMRIDRLLGLSVIKLLTINLWAHFFGAPRLSAACCMDDYTFINAWVVVC